MFPNNINEKIILAVRNTEYKNSFYLFSSFVFFNGGLMLGKKMYEELIDITCLLLLHENPSKQILNQISQLNIC